MKKFSRFFLFLILVFFLLFVEVKKVKGECILKNSSQHITAVGEFSAQINEGDKICQSSPIYSGVNSFCFGVNQFNDNVLQVNRGSKCSLPKEMLEETDPYSELKNYFRCEGGRWQSKEGSGVCYMKGVDQSNFWLNLDDNIMHNNVPNLEIELYIPPTPTPTPLPTPTPDSSGRKKMCKIPKKWIFSSIWKSFDRELEFGKSYCRKEGEAGVIYVCDDKSNTKIDEDAHYLYFEAREEKKCNYGEGQMCNFTDEVKPIGEISCQSIVSTESKLFKLPIPGKDCGNAESDVESERKCCSTDQTDPFQEAKGLLSFLEKIPGWLGGLAFKQLKSFFDEMAAFKNEIKPIPCYFGYPSTTDPNDKSCICIPASKIIPSPYKSVEEMCKKYLPIPPPGSQLAQSCSKCVEERQRCPTCAAEGGIWTSIGCLHGNLHKFIVEDVLGKALGFGGLIAILCVIYVVFTLQTSAGNPEKLKKARELLTSCIVGLLLIIFSVFILKLIGFDILRIPGFVK